LKILIVLNYRKSKSGITEQVLLLQNKLEECGFEVNLVNTFGSIPDRIKGLINSVKKGRASDLIIGAGCSYFGFYPIFAAATAAFLLNKKIIFNYHGGQAERFLGKHKFWLKKIFGNNIIVVASEYLLNVFKDAGYSSAVKVNNFFDFDNFPEADADFSNNGKVLWARSFEPLYQPQLALNIAHEICGKFDCEFHFYGDGSLYEEIKNKNENKKIFFHGLVDRNLLLREMKNYSVLLNTTVNDNVPNTIYEAGFYKLLVVSSRVGGINTTFGENEIAFAEENTKEEYVRIISDYFMKPDDYRGMRLNLHNKVKGYDWNNVKEKWLGIIKKNIGNSLKCIVL